MGVNLVRTTETRAVATIPLMIILGAALAICFATAVLAADYYDGGSDGYLVGTYGSKSKVRVKAPSTVFNGTSWKSIYDAYDTDSVRHFADGNPVFIAAEGINKMIGRTEWLTLELQKIGATVVIVPDDANIYDVPEYNDLKSTMSDGLTRVTIPGTPNKPIFVTRAGDVLRTGGSDRFELIHDFAKLYLQVGVKRGAPQIPRGPRDQDEWYDFYGHIEAAYDNAKANNLWPGTRMMDSLEEYFAEGSMVYWEVTPELPVWNREGGPVNTRLELKAYDRKLWDALEEVYPEFEYISSYSTSKTGTPPLPMTTPANFKMNNPWYKNSQKNEYGINGQPHPALAIVEANLIDPTRLEVIFNRDVANDYESEVALATNWTIKWTHSGDNEKNVADFTKTALGPYQFNRVTFNLNSDQATSADLYTGDIGQGIRGFTQKDIDETPWLKDGLTEAENAGTATAARTASTSAIDKGTFVGPDDMPSILNGTLTITFSGAVSDWSGNSLSGSTNVKLNPWFNKVYRSPEKGVYIYGDREVQRSSLEMAARYIDAILANPNDDIGKKMGDGVTANNGGMSIIGYDGHAYLQPTGRNSQGNNMHYYLYVEGFGGRIAQTTEFNLLRDIGRTKYRNEFILGHEFCHSIQSGLQYYLKGMNDKVVARYEASGGSTGLWHNTYPGSNNNEFFASLSTLWFSTMRESADGAHDNTWYPQNTRDELLRYDPLSYTLWKEMFYEGDPKESDDAVKNKRVPGLEDTPWQSYSTPNIYDIDGSLYNPPAIPFGIQLNMESNDGAVDALISVVDQSGKPKKIDSLPDNAANGEALDTLRLHGIDTLEVMDGRLLVRGYADEPFEIKLSVVTYTPDAVAGSPVPGSQGTEEIILRILEMDGNTKPNDGSGGSSSGCNAGFGAYALFSGAVLFAARRKK